MRYLKKFRFFWPVNFIEIYFDILVAADGKSSDVVNILNINNNFVSYDQNAIVMNVQIKDNITRNTSYQRFNRGDVQGLLPINGNTYNLIWSTDKENSEKLIKSKKVGLKLRILSLPTYLDIYLKAMRE